MLDALDLDGWATRREEHLRSIAPKQICLVAERDGALAGFVIGGPLQDRASSGEGEVYAIYVRDEHQRVGVVAALLSEAARRLHELGLHGLLIRVLRQNAKGRLFYERMGGRAERERPFEIAGARITETTYVRRDTALLRSRSSWHDDGAGPGRPVTDERAVSRGER